MFCQCVCVCVRACVFRPLPCFSQTRSCGVSPPEPTGSPDQPCCWTAPQRSFHPSWTHFSTEPWTTSQREVWCRCQSCRLIGRLWQEEARLRFDWPGKSTLKRRRKWLAVVFCTVFYTAQYLYSNTQASSYRRLGKHIKSLMRCVRAGKSDHCGFFSLYRACNLLKLIQEARLRRQSMEAHVRVTHQTQLNNSNNEEHGRVYYQT